MENLNDDVLMEIFKYCKCDSLSLTCKRFYNLVCKVKRYDLMFFPDELEKIYESLINSRKVIIDLAIYCIALGVSSSIVPASTKAKIKNIFKLKGANIQTLILEGWKIDAEYFFGILNYLPNLEKLHLTQIHVYHYNKSIGTLNLMHLKELRIDRCNEGTAFFFGQHLPQNVLTYLNVNHHVPELLINQQLIRKLMLWQFKLSSEWSPIANLTELTINSKSSEDQNLCSILKQQPDIEELDITYFRKAINGNKEAFASLCNLKKLKVLSMNANDLLHVEVETNFSKLKMLEELDLRTYTDDNGDLSNIIRDISVIRFENLKKLSININSIEITADQINQMGENCTNLNYLYITSTLAIDVFLDSFKCLNSLAVDYWGTRELSTICITLDDKIYPNLKELELNGLQFDEDSYQQNTEKLKKSLPNIVDMNLNIEDSMERYALESILEDYY